MPPTPRTDPNDHVDHTARWLHTNNAETATRKSRLMQTSMALGLLIMLLTAPFARPASVVRAAASAPLASLCSPQEAFARRPFAPTDPNLFRHEFYPDTPEMEPAPPRDISEQEALDRLNEYLQVQFSDPQQREEVLAIFNDPIAVEKFPSPSLRAALASLKGTFAEAAIDYYLRSTLPDGKDKVLYVIFDEEEEFVPVSEDSVAMARIIHVTNEAFYVFNKKYKGEDPLLLAGTLVHEAMHQDTKITATEEAVVYAFHTLFNLKLLSLLPDLAQTTALSRLQFSRALLRLNSGSGDKLGLFTSNYDALVLPGSNKAYRSWWEWFEDYPNVFGDTPGNAILTSYLSNIGASGASGADFSMEILNRISDAPDILTASEKIAAAHALRLAVPESCPKIFIPVISSEISSQ